MAYQGTASKRLYVSESPLLADDTSYQFVSSDVDDDTETARLNAMQAAYQAVRMRDARITRGGGGGGGDNGDDEDELQAEAQYQAALRERLLGGGGKPAAVAPVAAAAAPGNTAAAAAARRYGVPKLDLRDSVDDNRNYDEYAAVEDSLDFDTPRADEVDAKWSDPPPNPFAFVAAAAQTAVVGAAKPAAAASIGPKVVPAAAAAGARPFRLAQLRADEGDERSAQPFAAAADDDARATGGVGDWESASPVQYAPSSQSRQQPGALSPKYDAAARAWDYRAPQWDAGGGGRRDDAGLPPHAAAVRQVVRDGVDGPDAAARRQHQPERAAPAAAAASERPERPAGAASAPTAGEGIRHLPPKPLRPVPNFVEMNKSKALAVKDASSKGSYVERVLKKKEISEVLKDLAPGMRMPRKKAASADDVNAAAAVAAAASSSPGRPTPFDDVAAAMDDDQAEELWRQRANGLSVSKGPKNARGGGESQAAAVASEGKLQRRSSDSNISRPPHFVQPLSVAGANGGVAFAAAAYDGAPWYDDRSPPQGPSGDALEAAYAHGYQIPPLTFYPPSLPYAPAYGGGFAHPYAGFAPYQPVGPAFRPAFQLPPPDFGPYASAAGRPPGVGLMSGPPRVGLQGQGGMAAPYGGDYYSLPDLDARSTGDRPFEAAAAWPDDAPPQRLSQAQAEQQGRLSHYVTVPPIRTAPAAADGGGSYTQQFAQQREKERRRTENPAYTAYTLTDYKKLEKEIKLGGLGPSLDPLTLREKNEKRLRQLQYAKQAVEQQRRLASQAQKQAAKQQSAADAETAATGEAEQPTERDEDGALSRRQAAIEYAKSVPKPKLKVRPPQNESPAPASAAGGSSDSKGSTALGDRERTPKAAALTPLSKLGDADLAMLHQRHQLEKMAVMELHKNARAAV